MYLRKARSTKTIFSTMKAFVAVALAADAEADPQVLLAQPSVYLGNAHTQTANLVQHANGAVVPDETLSVKAAKAEHLTAKATAYLNKPVVPVVQTVASVASPVYSGYTGYTAGLYNPYTTLALGKREAEAEAEAKPEADPLTIYNAGLVNGVVPNLYNGVYNYVPTVATAQTVVPTVAKTIIKTPVVAKCEVYYPYPCVYSGLYNHGVYGLNTHIIKREADAEADPAVFYNNYYNAPAYTTGLYNGYTGNTGYGINNYAYNPVYGYNNLGYNYLY